MFTPSSGPGRPPQSSQPSDWPAGSTPPEAPRPAGDDNIAVAIPTRTIRRIGMAVGAVIVLGLLVVGFLNRGAIGSKLGGGLAGQIDSKSYQAVFLVGSQVYFGHLHQSGSVYLLSDVYYIADGGASADSSQPRGQLVKRGSEIHGPRDPMVIPTAQLLFIENMRDDSDVVRAITASKASGGVPNAPSNAPPAATQPPATATPTRTATPGASLTPTPQAPVATPTVLR